MKFDYPTICRTHDEITNIAERMLEECMSFQEDDVKFILRYVSQAKQMWQNMEDRLISRKKEAEESEDEIKSLRDDVRIANDIIEELEERVKDMGSTLKAFEYL